MRDKIDGVLIDSDENGFHLILSGEEREYNFTLGLSAALDLLKAVKTEIEPWHREGVIIAARDAPFLPEPYELSDPKHPDYHNNMSEIWDSREGK